MANLFLGWPNRIDAGTLSGGSWDSTLALTNLQDRSLAVVARSADAANASTKFNLDLGAAHSLRAFGIFNHNLSQSAQVRISLGTTSGGTDVYAGSWVDAFEITFGSGSDEWSSYNWWSPMSDDEYVRNPFAVIVVLAAFYSARYVTIEFDDTGNSDGWVQLGRVFVGGGLYPAYNATYGLEDGWVDGSQLVEMESGREVAQVRRRRRTVRFALEVLSQASEFGVAHEMQRRLGTTGEILYVPNAADAVLTQRTGFLGRMRSINPIAYPSFRRRSMPVELIEIL